MPDSSLTQTLSAATGGHYETDVAIIGAGPVGLFAVFECGMLKLSCHVVDALDAVGGQCRALYPEKPIFDIPGYPRINADELVDRLTEQAAPFDPIYHLGQQVMGLERDGNLWRLSTSADTVIRARTVIIAAGVGAFGPNRPPLAGIEAFENAGPGLGVHYLVGRREDYRSKNVVIAGGGDSAVDWANSLTEVAAHVSVVHRRHKFRALPESVAQMKALAEGPGLDLVVPYQLAGLDGDDGQLEAVIVRDLDGNEKRLQADVLLPFFGLAQNLGPIAEWGLNLERSLIPVDPSTMAATLGEADGIFAIGDIATYPGKLKLILTGFSEAAFAAHAARSLIFPDEALHFEYSTSKGVPGS